MTTLRPFTADDMFRFNNVYPQACSACLVVFTPTFSPSFPFSCLPRSNLDSLTETYNLSFYLQYLARWPDYFSVSEAPNGTLMGYSAPVFGFSSCLFQRPAQSWARPRAAARSGTAT